MWLREEAIDRGLVCRSRCGEGQGDLLSREASGRTLKVDEWTVQRAIGVACIQVIAELPAQVIQDGLELRSCRDGFIRQCPQEYRPILLDDSLCSQDISDCRVQFLRANVVGDLRLVIA